MLVVGVVVIFAAVLGARPDQEAILSWLPYRVSGWWLIVNWTVWEIMILSPPTFRTFDAGGEVCR